MVHLKLFARMSFWTFHLLFTLYILIWLPCNIKKMENNYTGRTPYTFVQYIKNWTVHNYIWWNAFFYYHQFISSLTKHYNTWNPATKREPSAENWEVQARLFIWSTLQGPLIGKYRLNTWQPSADENPPPTWVVSFSSNQHFNRWNRQLRPARCRAGQRFVGLGTKFCEMGNFMIKVIWWLTRSFTSRRSFGGTLTTTTAGILDKPTHHWLLMLTNRIGLQFTTI